MYPLPKKRKGMYIFDLDGTLADCTHRLKYIQGEEKDWDAFHHNTSKDSAILPTIEILNALSDRNPIYIVTGRNDVAEEDTRRWLFKYGVKFDVLVMRSENDRRHDTVIKREWLRKFREENPNRKIQGVFEDRQQVVDMWREEGLICYQVAPGDF